ncbi:hypothetical protein [Maritalea porphyrae]|uniref:hypothetical protein n=1 Tax=Maritalea porphyrae TaxID=880732 RepID=UPI0022AF4A25|nr:hypothetical protein [Maritalea porphyrae]MCZ4273006.1 hypothetical protein [Maritalea porphyrae]
MDKPKIEPGKNIAMKVPSFKWAETVSFYRDKVGLRQTHKTPNSIAFEFGAMTLWIDRVEKQSQTDIWLELFTPSPDEALLALGGPSRDELEELEDNNGRWTSDPAGVVLLLRDE